MLAGKLLATMLLHLLFHLICYTTWQFFEEVEFLTIVPTKGRRRGFGENICYHVAAFLILFNLIDNVTML